MPGPPVTAPAAPPTDVASPPCPGGGAAGCADLAAVIAEYPGPAILVSGDDAILAANRLAEPLLAEERDWWSGIAMWRSAALAGLATHRSTQIARPGGAVVYEWAAMRLPGSRLLMLGRDATLERRLRNTLTESRQRYKDLVEASSDFAWETGPDGRFVFLSPRGALGFPAETLVGHHPRELVLEDDGDITLPFDSRRQIDHVELWLRGADGEPAYLQTSVKPLFGNDGAWIGARGVCRDLTERALRNAELGRVRNRERVLNHIVHTLRDQLDAAKALEVAAHETTRALDTAGCAIHRLDADGAPLPAAAHGDSLDERLSFDELNTLVREAAASPTPVERSFGSLSMLACRTCFHQAVNGTVCVWRDAAAGLPWDDEARELIAGVADRIGITHAQLAYQEHLRHLSERDSLTGLFNRRTFLERLEEMLTWRDFGGSALLYIDLDNFKAVNDLRGHQQGDEVLRAVAALIGEGVRPGDLCGRMGGDEFVLWLARTDERAASTVARRLLAGMERLRPLSASEARPLGMSIGIAVHHPSHGEGIAALIERADAAMYRAKQDGKGGFHVAGTRPQDAAAPGEEAS